MSRQSRIAFRLTPSLAIAIVMVVGLAVPAVAADVPAIASFSPTSGAVGTSVTLNGTNFVDVTDVRFKTASATFNVDSSTKITATVPTDASTGKIAVVTSSGTAHSSGNFTVTTSVPAPTIGSFSPTSGPVGTSVTIDGTNFSGSGFTTSSVKFNGVSATSFTVNSSSKITATVPSGATDGKISVTTPGGTATSSKSFDVTTPSVPTISSFSPTSGLLGTSVTINGSNFTGATSVKFNGVSAAFTVNSSSKITGTVPSGATTGKISVTTPGGTATSSGSFTVTGLTHARTVSLQLTRHLVASGSVLVTDGFAACRDQVPVKVQRRVSGRWRTVAQILTQDDGSYRAHLANRVGRYRARATRLNLASGDICTGDTSAIKLNRR